MMPELPATRTPTLATGTADQRGTLTSLLAAGTATALRVPDGPDLSYDDLRRMVARIAETLAAVGIRREDRVATVLPTALDAVVAFLGVATAATAAPLNPAYPESELRFYLPDVEAKALIVPPGGGAAARQALPAGALVLELAVGPDGGLEITSDAPRTPGRTPSEPQPDDVALVLHSSGTTGRPKQIPIRHRNLVASAGNIASTYQLQAEDVSLAVMPLFHVHGLVASVLATLRTGGAVVLPAQGFNALRFLSLVSGYGVTWYTMVPTMHQMMLTRCRDGERPAGIERLRFVRSCSAALPLPTYHRLEAVLDVPVLEAFGMTEASHQAASNPLPPALRVPGTVGLGTGVEIGIMDDRGRLLPRDTPGELVLRGPSVVDTYYNNPAATAAAFTDGWFRTGDNAVVEANGYLRLVGRIKEMINRGGEKIWPSEVDQVLGEHPAVKEAVAFGVPHPTWGEQVAAAVVTQPGLTVTEAELQQHCRERLAGFKTPTKVYLVESIPRTATGKIQRRRLAELLSPPGAAR